MKKIIMMFVFVIAIFICGCSGYVYRDSWRTLKGEPTKEQLQDYFIVMLKSQLHQNEIIFDESSWREYVLNENYKKYFFKFSTKSKYVYQVEIIDIPEDTFIKRHYLVLVSYPQ